MTARVARYKPLFLHYFHIPPYDVGRMTLRDLFMACQLADEYRREK